MKEKILSAIPYLLLILFFAGVIIYNNGFREGDEALFSYELDTPVPNISAEQESPISETNQTETEETDTECYFTSSGRKYHLDKSCGYLKNSKQIFTTTVTEAEKNGLQPCSGCASN